MKRITSILVLILLFFMSGKLYSDANKTEPKVILEQANEQFQKGLNAKKSNQDSKEYFSLASSLYEQMIKENKIVNGYLYYNVGNCYFYLNQIGKAIFYYRCAEKFIPDNEDLQGNIKTAINKRIDKITPKQFDTLLDSVLFWNNWFSLKSQIILFSIAFVLIWVIMIIKLFHANQLYNYIMLISIIFSIVFFISISYCLLNDNSNQFAVIISPEVEVRKGPGATYEPKFTKPLHEGTEGFITEKRDTWYRLIILDGRECWIQDKDILVSDIKLTY